jgi:hypothetical protein
MHFPIAFQLLPILLVSVSGIGALFTTKTNVLSTRLRIWLQVLCKVLMVLAVMLLAAHALFD